MEEHILVENSFESILSRKVFYEVQEIINNQRHTPPKSKSSPYLLTCLIKCGYCGSSMYGHTFNDKRKAGRVYRYYRCNSHLQKGSSICKGNTIEVAYLENAFFEELKKFRVNPQALEEKIKEHNLQYLDTVGPLKMQQKQLENKISKLDEKTTRLFSLYEDAIISKREFAERKTVLDEQRRLLNSELYELQQKITLDDMTSVDLNGTPESIGNLADVYDELEFSEKKELIGTIIGDIVVGEDWVDYSIYSLNKAVAYYDCMDTRAVANCNNLKFFKINFRIAKIPPIQPTSFGNCLTKLRCQKKLSQRDLALQIGVSQDSIRNWEKDRFLPQSAYIDRIAQFFQIDEQVLNFEPAD